MTNHPLRFLACFVVLLSHLGCGSSDDAGGRDEPEPPSERELEGSKLNVYVRDCYNAVDANAHRVVETYLDFVRWSDGLTSIENGPGSLDPRVSAGVCRSAAERAAAMPPSLPSLEAAADAYAGSLEALLPLLTEARPYYERHSYRDDGGGGAREMHPRLVAAMDAFRAASRRFAEEIDHVEDRRQADRLAELEADPTRRGTYLVERMQAHARRLLAAHDAMMAAARAGAVSAEMRSAYLTDAGTLQAEVDEIRAYRAAPSERLPSGFNTYAQQTENLLTGEMFVLRYVRDHDHIDPRWLGRAMEHAIRGFNTLVEAYNRLRFPD